MIAYLQRLCCRVEKFFSKKKPVPERPDEAQKYIDECKTQKHLIQPHLNYDVLVLGEVVKVGHPELCRECIEKSLNEFSTKCDACGCVIMPGMAVAVSCQKKEFSKGYPYTCMGWDCCIGLAYCGVWGMGRLVTLHELNPDKYAAGCAHIGDAVINGPPEGVVIVNDFNAP